MAAFFLMNDLLPSSTVPCLAALQRFGAERLRLPGGDQEVLFLSLSDGSERALTVLGRGADLAAAWLELPGAGFYLLATPLMMFGEAFLTGGAMALIVVYRPHWCSTFDDARYLRPR